MNKPTEKRKLGRAVRMAATVVKVDASFTYGGPAWRYRVTCVPSYKDSAECAMSYQTEQPGIKPGDEVEVAVRLVKKPLDRPAGRG
jgi:hypothetical protein